jgi:hypothetical protein
VTFLESELVANFAGAQRYKPSVRIAHGSNVTLASEQTLQSVSLLADDDVCLYGQTNAKENGLWTVKAGGWVRRGDADAVGDLVAGVMVFIEAGTNAGGLITLTTTGIIYPGQTNQTWQIYTPALVFGGGGGVTSQIDPGDAVSAGVAATAARADHQHAVNSATASTPSTLVARDANGVSHLAALKAGNGADPATAGEIRLPATASIRYGASSRYALATSEAGGVVLGQIEKPVYVEGSTVDVTSDDTIDVAALGVFSLSAAIQATCTIDGTQVFKATSSAFRVDVASLAFEAAVSHPLIQQQQRTGDNAPFRTRVFGQGASSTSTGANMVGGAHEFGGGEGKVAGTNLAGPSRHIGGVLVSNACAPLEFRHGASGASTKYAEIGQSASGITRMLAQAALRLEGTTNLFGAAGAIAQIHGATDVELSLGAGSRKVRIGHNGTAGTTGSGTAVLQVETDGSTTTAVFGEAQASKIQVATRTTDAAPKALTLQPGQPNASATADNRKPADLDIDLGSPTNSGTTWGLCRILWGANSVTFWGHAEVTTTDATATVLFAQTMPDNSSCSFKGTLHSFRTDSGTNANIDFMQGGAKRRGAGATLVAAADDGTQDLHDDAAFTAFGVGVNSNDARIEVQGRGAETWNHRLFFECTVNLNIA